MHSIRPLVSQDSLLTILAQGVEEKYMLYARYELIPGKASFEPNPQNGMVLLLTSRCQVAALTEKFLQTSNATVCWQETDATLGFTLLQLK